MQNDLISRSEAMKMLARVELDKGSITDARTELDKIPIAYDIERVVDDIKSLCGYAIYRRSFDLIIQIVRNGRKK